MNNKPCEPPRWLLILIPAALLFWIFLTPYVHAATWDITGKLGDQADTITFMKYTNGSFTDSSKNVDSTYGWDTTITTTAGSFYKAVYKIHYVGYGDGIYVYWPQQFDDRITSVRDSIQYLTTADVSALATAVNLTKAIDSINAILDTLQLYDGRLALEASVTAMRDSLQYLTTADVSALATAANLTKAIDSINAILDTLQDGVNGPDVNATATVSTSDKQSIASYVNDTLTNQHSSGSWAAGAGSGANTVVIWVIDTSGTDDTTSGVNVTVYSAAGTLQGTVQKSNDSGFVKYSLDDGAYSVVAENNNYYFPTATVTIAGASGVDTTSISGYDRTVASPTDASLATVTVDVTKIGGKVGQNLYGLSVCAYNEIVGIDAHGVDTVGGSKVILPEADCKTTDSTGRAILYLIKSSDYADTTRGFYRIEGKRGSITVFKYENLYITGDINLGDSLLSR